MATVELTQSDLGLATGMLLDGAIVAGAGNDLSVMNPGTGNVTVRFPGASLDQFRSAIATARATFDGGSWSGVRREERVAILRRFIDLCVAQSADLRGLIVTETGCPTGSFALGAQVDGPLRQMYGALDLYMRLPEIEENPIPLEERINSLGGFVQSLRRYQPVGVVAAISAYNFPVHISLWKVVPALAAGCCVILRPSPLTPLSALWLAQRAVEAGLPKGILSVLAEGGADGALLMTTDPAVDMVSFTGSSEIGSKVAAQAAPSMKRLQLELGGKSAAIYLPDRIDAAFHAGVTVCLAHAGQGCVLGTRVFVPEAEKAKVLAGIAASFAHAKIGDTNDPTTTMGPVISEAQVERCGRYVAAAVAAGAKVVAGGKRADHAGYFFEPTVLDCPDNKNPAAQDEIFGPVVCVIGYRDVDHAIEMANDSSLGLSGYVHGKDARAALDVATRIRSGTVNVNAFFASAYASSGGVKMSGIGRERGVEGIRAFQDVQVLNLGSAS